MKKKILSLVLAVVMVFTLSVPAVASSVDTDVAICESCPAAARTLSNSNAFTPDLDLSLDDELAQADYVWKYFVSANTMNLDAEFANPKEDAGMFIPEGANCTDICRIGSVLYIDYQLNGARYIVSYYQNGEVEKSVRAIGEDDFYSVDSRDYVINHFNTMEDVQTVEISDEEASRRIELMQCEGWTGDLSYPLNENVSRATIKTVIPVSYKNNPSTAPYKAKIVNSGQVKIDAFTGTSYNVYQPYRIYETMSYHTEVKHTTKLFGVNTKLTEIALQFAVSLVTAKSWLDYALVAYSTLNALEEACEVVSESEYTFFGGKECGIYDPTENKTYVETYASWDTGKIALGWEYNSSTGYNNPSWVITARCDSLSTKNETIKENGRTAYNNNISNVGKWKWGPGNGFGY
ncbi:hypothetical protein [Bacteroides caecimuris]|uniref:hypothetical protein n=1 Tax=Bacteroides caecimuris TaxID=1796613 RepID=UPI002573C9DE|nr:hypothetical protein [Bacteroides caecimuris]